MKSPHTSVLGWAAGAGAPKSKRGAGSAESGEDGRKLKPLCKQCDNRLTGFTQTLGFTFVCLHRWEALASGRRDESSSLCTRRRREKTPRSRTCLGATCLLLFDILPQMNEYRGLHSLVLCLLRFQNQITAIVLCQNT